jgi:SAM-dependent methyltransferase
MPTVRGLASSKSAGRTLDELAAFACVSAEVWGEDVAREYDRSSAYMFAPRILEPTIDFLQRRAAGGPALELAIGTGRVGLPLRARGVPVCGIELSESMLAQLREKPGGDGIPVVVGDMSTARVDGAFRLVYLVYNTITNLLSQDEQVACFGNAARHLESGGSFVIEVGIPDLRRLPPGEDALVFHVGEEHVGVDTYDVVAQRLVSHHYWVTEGRSVRSRHRYVWPAELDLMARLAGMQLTQRWGGWREEPFTADSRSHVSVWTKP